MDFKTNQPKGETKECKYCGSDIPAKAKVCPYCNKKQSHTVRNVVLIVVGVIILLILLFSCMGGGGDSDETTSADAGVTTQTDSAQTDDTQTDEADQEAADEQTQQDYTVGSTFTADDVSATLNSVSVSMGDEFSTPQEGYEFLVCNWTVVNDGGEEFNPIEFSTSGYVDGATVEPAITGLPDQFDMGTMIIPGSSSTGNKVYEVPQGWQQFQIRAQIGTIGGETQIFTVTPDQVS